MLPGASGVRGRTILPGRHFPRSAGRHPSSRPTPHAHDVPHADRGAGAGGARPVAAGLADPYADAMAVKLVDN